MSLTICRCDMCGTSAGGLPFVLKIEQAEYCDKCRQTKTDVREFRFCSKKCLDKWLAKQHDGYPCAMCSGTGWFGRFKSNGKCGYCKKGVVPWAETEKSSHGG